MDNIDLACPHLTNKQKKDLRLIVKKAESAGIPAYSVFSAIAGGKMDIESCGICVGGNEPRVQVGRCEVIRKDNFQVVCPNCGCSGPCCFDKGESISHWNNLHQAYDEHYNG